mmetsp:Transcript_93345/g.156900  ORF Transcript_93345/g.156900 Transcript_93345/m.156900 type:complete len:83 (-) Transcript_93345:488-736(-)
MCVLVWRILDGEPPVNTEESCRITQKCMIVTRRIHHHHYNTTTTNNTNNKNSSNNNNNNSNNLLAKGHSTLMVAGRATEEWK